MEIYDHIGDDEPEGDSTGIIWMFLVAGFIAVAIQGIKYLIKFL